MESVHEGAPPLSINCVIHSLDGGGAERVMAGLASRLSDRGHSVRLITLLGTDHDRYPLSKDVKRVGIGIDPDKESANPIFRVRRRHRLLRDAIAEQPGDVILSFCDRMNIDVLLAVGSRYGPVVVSERSDPTQQKLGAFWNTVRQHVYRWASQVVALTDSSAALLRAFSRRVHVIPSAVGNPGSLSDRELAQECKIIVGAGRFAPEKGFERLIRAFATATKDHPDWRLVVYGDGPLRGELIALSRELGIETRVEFPGWVAPLHEAMRDATVFCLSSHYEGFPSVLLEAMSMGIPSLSVDCESGPRMIIDNESNGLLVEPSERGLARGIARLIEDAEFRETIGRAGCDVVDRFGWETMVDRYEQVLYQAVSDHQQGLH